MYETCGDNRFEIIQKAKDDLIQATNIADCQVDMEYIDSFLFRAWQMGWLDKYETSAMSFGMAIKAAKNGKKIARKGWNGKNQYVELASCVSYKNASGEIVNVDHSNIGNKALAFVGTSGVQLGWLASQADMLADDWVFQNEEEGAKKEFPNIPLEEFTIKIDPPKNRT